MELSDGLVLVMIAVEAGGHIPVIAVDTNPKDINDLKKFGFDVSNEQSGIFPASLTVPEIHDVALNITMGKLRHNRPMPRKHQLAI